jgi:hypothetical protein
VYLTIAVITVDKDFNLIRTDRRSKVQQAAHTLVSACQEKVLSNDTMDLLEKVEALTTCIESSLNETLKEKQEEHDFQSNLRASMATQLIPYACNDFEFNTTEEVQNVTFTYRYDGGTQKYQIKLIHERPSSVIVLVENFATPAECGTIKRLMGTQSNNEISWAELTTQTEESESLFYLMDAIYEVAQNFLELEDFEFEEYVEMKSVGPQPLWREAVDVVEKTVDCDTSRMDDTKCQLPSQHISIKDEARLATAFIACEDVPKGGAINFPYAGVHINPKPGMLIFAAHRVVEHPFDGFVQDYHLCPYHNFYIHNILEEPMSRNAQSHSKSSRDEL